MSPGKVGKKVRVPVTPQRTWSGKQMQEVEWYLGASFLGRAGADHRVSVGDGLCFKAKRKA